jgi:stage IV sporulation protein FB
MEGWEGIRSIELCRYSVRIRSWNRTFVVEIYYLILLIPIFMYLTGYLTKYLMALISMLLHELGHLLVALLLLKRVYAVKALPIGFNALVDESDCSLRESLLIYLGGPIVNILLLVSCLLINSYYLPKSDNMLFFTSINLYFTALNMIPILPMDGGRILRNILSVKAGIFLAHNIIRRVSGFFSVLIIVLGIVQLYYSSYNFSLLAIGVYLLFFIKSDNMEAPLMNIKQIIYRRSRLLKKGIYPARHLVVIQSAFLNTVIQSMDFDRFHIIHVLDDKMKLIKTFSEQELMDSMLNYNTDLTFGELIKLMENASSWGDL